MLPLLRIGCHEVRGSVVFTHLLGPARVQWWAGGAVRGLRIRREVEKSKDLQVQKIRPPKRKNAAEVTDTGMAVALVGRPNVGKSTIFNRLLHKEEARGYRAIVHPTPGVTRDVTYAPAVIHDLRFLAFDTAGLEEHLRHTQRRKRITSFFENQSVAGLAALDDSEVYRALYRDMALKTALAVQQADVALFVVDGSEGMTDVDRQIGIWLMSIHKPENIVLIANKYDTNAAEENFHDFYELGLGEPVPLAAHQGLGFADVYLKLAEAFDTVKRQKEECAAKKEVPTFAGDEDANKSNEKHLSEAVEDDNPVAGEDQAASLETKHEADSRSSVESKDAAGNKGDLGLPLEKKTSTAWRDRTDENVRDILVSVVGKPNVGKSTLVNKLIGKNVCLTGPAPGVTRDAVSIDHVWKGKPVKLVDTAGLRRRTDVTSRIETMCMEKTIHAIRSGHVSILVMDAREIRIARLVLDEGRALMVALNKWDLIPGPERNGLKKEFDERTASLFPATRGVKMVPISALRMERHFELLDSACTLHERWSGYLKTSDLNQWLREFKKLVPIPKRKGSKSKKKFNLVFVAQTKARPPTFTFRGAHNADVPDVYRRTLENGLRKQFNWEGTPIRMKFVPREVVARKTINAVDKAVEPRETAVISIGKPRVKSHGAASR